MGITAINGVEITASLTSTASYARSVSGAAVSNTATYYPFFSNVNGGTSNLFTNGSLIYNPGVGQLTALYFSASSGFVGTASVANTASRANAIDTVAIATNALYYPTLVDSNNGSLATELVYTDGTLNYNPSTNELRSDIINIGSGASLTFSNDANLTMDASLTQSINWTANLAATRSLIVNNLAQGRQVRVYIRNTNGTQRQIIFSGSATTSGHTGINMAINAGAASATIQPIAASSGTMYVIMENIGGTIVGGVM